MTSVEQELQWAQQDLRIAAENLQLAERRLDEARFAYQECLDAVNLARLEVRKTVRDLH